MPAAGEFSVKRVKPTVIMNFAGRVLNVHTGVSRFFVSTFILSMFLGFDFGAKKKVSELERQCFPNRDFLILFYT